LALVLWNNGKMMKHILFAILFFSPVAQAAPPPTAVTRAAYVSWLASIDSAASAFTDKIFAWEDEQLRNPIPSQVNADPDKIYIAVARPMAETIALEQAGEIEEGNTIGFEAYAIINAPIATVLEVKLFTWGKPVGKVSGDTYPFDSVFSQKHDQLRVKWGTGNYFLSSDTSGGGIVKNLHDDYTLLVRGSESGGYTLYAGFFGPRENTPTTSHMSIVMLRPLTGGKTEFRQSVRQQGQSYKIFGIDYGRRNFGFNAARVRQGQKQFYDMAYELKNTGKIKENRP